MGPLLAFTMTATLDPAAARASNCDSLQLPSESVVAPQYAGTRTLVPEPRQKLENFGKMGVIT